METKIACFGVPSVFSFKSNVCGSCKEFSECQDNAYSALLAIREYPIATTALSQHVEFRVRSGLAQNDALELDITKPIPKHSKRTITRYALTEEQLIRISNVPKKIGKFLERVWVKGIDKQIDADVLAGNNPFSKHNARPYFVAYELLQEGRVHRNKMSTQLMEQLGWTYASAYSQVSMIWQIFPELGLAIADDKFLAKPIQNNQSIMIVIEQGER